MPYCDKRFGRFLITFCILAGGLCLGFWSENVLAQSQTTDPYHCASEPKFIKTVGMRQPVAIDTQQSRLPGVVVRELKGAKRVFRHPSWEQSGHVTNTVRDQHGHIYTVPVPSVGLDTNPLERRNIVYRIDSVSGVMSKFIELPLEGEHSQRNPFGTMGLTLDCHSQSLYVSSVANSTPTEIKGVIYKVNLQSAEIDSMLAGIDAIGLGLFDTGDGKRLYYGDARSSSVYSLALQKNGDFLDVAKPKYEFSLLSIKNGDSTQVRRIRFIPDGKLAYKLVATDTEFSFRMLAESTRRFRHYEFIWDTSSQKWEFDKVQ